MANEVHAVIRTDLMTGTDVAADLRSVRYMGDGESATDIDNGCVVKLDGLMDGEREIFKGVTPAGDTPLDEIVVIATPEVMYDQRKRNLTDFYNEAGRACRGYIMHKNDMFGVTAEALDGTPEVGYVVELQADVKMKVVESATGGSTTVGKIVAVETAGRHTYYVILVA